jgi:hypothetical protein
MRIVWLRSVVGERGKWSLSATPAAERRRKPATFVAVLKMQARDERAACEAQRNNPRVGHGGQRFFYHLELLWPARRKFGDRLADFDWIKCGHKMEWVECEPGNWPATMWTRRCRNGDNSLPVCDCGKIVAVANSCSWKVHDCGLAADNP